jgi:hypothetical protein
MTHAPALEPVNDDQDRERDDEQHDRDGGRLAVGELLEAGHDQDRRDLGPVRHVAGDEDDRAVLPDAAREGEGEAGEEGRPEGRHHHVPERLKARRPQRRRRLFRLRLHVLQDRLDGPHHEREADEDQDQHDA